MRHSNRVNAQKRHRNLQEERKAATRPLTRGEINIIPPKLRRAIDVAKVRVIDAKHNFLAGDNIVTSGNNIFCPGRPADVSTPFLTLGTRPN